MSREFEIGDEPSKVGGHEEIPKAEDSKRKAYPYLIPCTCGNYQITKGEREGKPGPETYIYCDVCRISSLASSFEGAVKTWNDTVSRTKSNARHDQHYAQSEIQPIEVIENRIELGAGEVPKKAFNSILMSLKYILRAGLKEGQPWEKDIEKAINYLNRALTGKWVD